MIEGEKNSRLPNYNFFFLIYKQNVIFLTSYIEDMIHFMKNTFNSILSQLKEIQKNFGNKMRILEDLISSKFI